MEPVTVLIFEPVWVIISSISLSKSKTTPWCFIDCPICIDSKPYLEISTPPCQCKACPDCLSDWIIMKIQEQGIPIGQTIDCIVSNWKKPFPIHSIYSNILPLTNKNLIKPIFPRIKLSVNVPSQAVHMLVLLI